MVPYCSVRVRLIAVYDSIDYRNDMENEQI